MSDGAPRGYAYELRVLVLLGLAYGFAFYDRMALTFLSPFVVADLKLNNVQVGALGAGLSATWALGALLIGRWSDRIGKRKPFLLGAMVVFSLCSVLSGLSHGFWPLLISRVIMGAAEGPFLPVCLAIIAAASAKRRYGLNTGILQNGFGSLLGNALGPLLLVWIATHWGWRASFYTSAIPGLVLVVLVWRFIDEPPAHARATSEGARPSLWALIRVRNVWLCGIISCLLVGTVVIGSIFLPLYLTGPKGFAPSTMAGIMAVLGICPAVGGVLVPWLSDRIGRRWPLAIFGAATAITPLAALTIGGPVWLLTAVMFIGWLGLGTFPLFMGVVPAESLGGRDAATAMGLVIAIGELSGGVLGPIFAGWLADAGGLSMPLNVQVVMGLIGGAVALLLRETNPSRTQEVTS